MTGFRDYFILKVFGLADSLLGAIKLNVHKNFRRYPGCILTHFSPMSHFYPPPPPRTTSENQRFSDMFRGKEM